LWKKPKIIIVRHLNDVDVLFDFLKLLRTSLAAKQRDKVTSATIVSSKVQETARMQAGEANLTCLVMRRV
jgi:hypothetical protein